MTESAAPADPPDPSAQEGTAPTLQPSALAGKSVHPAPDMEGWRQFMARHYHLNYKSSKGLLRKWAHRALEKDFGPDARYDTVLEIGAGFAAHIDYLRHPFEKYVLADIRPEYLKMTEESLAGHPQFGKLEFLLGNARELPYEDNSIDRAIANNVLEHIPAPGEVLQELARVVRPGGAISVILPCDPGLAWRTGRRLAGSQELSRADYEYFMALEHVNSIYNMRAIVRRYFPKRSERWLPARIPAPDVNLFWVVNLFV